MLIDKQFRTKFEKKSKEMILVGYEPDRRAYRLWERGTRKIVTARDVEIIENIPKKTAIIIKDEITDSPIQKEKEEEEVETSKQDAELTIKCTEISKESEPIAHRTRSKRQLERIAEENVKDLSQTLIVEALLAEGTPFTYEEAINSSASKQWEAAMTEELQSLTKNNTWELVDLPVGRKAIQNKWVYRIKQNPNGLVNRYKARLVIKGCSQIAGIDYNETFSPVARFESIRILLALAAINDYEIFQFDIKTAFLHGNLEEEIFMTTNRIRQWQ